MGEEDLNLMPSTRAVTELGDRLREGASLSEADLRLLGEHLIAHDAALGDAAGRLQRIGLEPTTRLKTSGTIVENFTRRQIVEAWINVGDSLHVLALRENELQRLRSSASTAADWQRAAEMESEVDAVFGDLRTLVHSISEQTNALEKPESG